MSLYLGTQKLKAYLNGDKKRVFAGRPDYLVFDGRLVWADPKIYLESAGTPRYINTGFVPDALCRYDFAYSTNISNNTALFGQRTSGSYNTSTDQLYHNPRANNSDTQKFIYGRSSYSDECLVNQKYALSYTDARTDYASTEQPIYLFAMNITGSAGGHFKGKFYYLKIYNGNDELIHHFVPVPSGMVIGNTTISANGMFDIVTQTPFYNSGTGDFTYGKDN